MHLLRAIGDAAGKYLEFAIEGADCYPWQYGLYVEDPFTIEDGHAEVTDQPGWGGPDQPGLAGQGRVPGVGIAPVSAVRSIRIEWPD